MGENIKTVGGAKFDWSDGKRAASIEATYKAILEKLDGSITWYQDKRVLKRQCAWGFRVSAVVLGTAAAAIPTLSEMTNGAGGPAVRPGIATILGVVVGALLLLDRLIGASSAWIRFTMAETALKELRDELGLAFALEAGLWAGKNEPSVEQTRHAVATLQGFLVRVNQIIHDETDRWKAEFQSALQQVDELARAQTKRLAGAVETEKVTKPSETSTRKTARSTTGPKKRGSRTARGSG
ncbi:MAG: SLATT domain-containing protein [Planctomycetota bacterium]|jgi:hypothetical protein